ncbi:MAG: hypothetical protein CMK71_08320 [Pseudomonadaceae bacterium]|nr:hypothetical protein [Pseudomonadaceae bacterium]
MTKLALTTLTTALLLSGCSMTPTYEKPSVPVSELYLNQNTAGVTSAPANSNSWWTQFNDPQLNQLVIRAQNQNVSLQIVSQRIQAAQAYHKVISSMKVPTIALTAGYYDLRISENDPLLGDAVSGVQLPAQLGGGEVKVADRDPDAFTVGLSASWEMDLFGRVDSLSKASSIRLEQARIMKTAMNTLITADVVNNYLQYRGAVERINIAKRNISEQQETLKLVQSLERNGYGSSMDVANAKSALAATQATLPMLDTAKSVHMARLAILLGENIGETEKHFSPERLPQMNALIPTGLPSELLKRRPDIAMAEREMAAKNEEVGAAIAAKYPKIFLTGSPALLSSDFNDLFKSSSEAWMLGAGISWNLYDGGRSQALVEMQEAGFKQSALNYQQKVNSAFNEVETTLTAYGNSQKYHALIQQASEQAQIASNKADSLYRSGMINHLNVLDTQRQKNSIEDAEVVARLNTATQVVLLHKALGGDWSVAAAGQTDESSKPM